MEVESLWRSRLRWRLRGALLWPAFIATTLLDAVLLVALPIAGDDGPDLVGAALLAMFFNLVAVAVLSPLAAMALRRRRRDLPFLIAQDATGTILIGLVTVGLLVAGLLHRPQRTEVRRDFGAQLRAAQAFAHTQAPHEFRARLDEATSLRMDDELYRTCVPGPDPQRWFCMYVDTGPTPPAITVDESRESNASMNRLGAYR